MTQGLRPELSCTWGAAAWRAISEAVGQRRPQRSLCYCQTLAADTMAVPAADASLQRAAEHALQWPVWCAEVAATHDTHIMLRHAHMAALACCIGQKQRHTRAAQLCSWAVTCCDTRRSNQAPSRRQRRPRAAHCCPGLMILHAATIG